MYKLASLILMICLCYSLASAANLVPDTCKKISQLDPEHIKYDTCVAKLESDPKSSTSSVPELAVISLQLDISKANSVSSTIQQLLKDPKFDPFVKSALGACSDLYNNILSDLGTSLAALKNKDYLTANMRIGSALDSASTCEKGFTEKKGEVSPLSKENGEFSQFAAISLGFTEFLSEVY